ncbi:MAG: NAD(P)-dependent glycerol-3-phosphate dehydrogenase [Desulfuromonadales bacterium]|nr:NAD(P)-dependent glycerol-3-phosphate dehydrogenase [Desulfuromonadales bacterium]
MKQIGVIGAGSWGTTLADLLASKGYFVTLWAYEADLVERMRVSRENDLYLAGAKLSENLTFTNNLTEAVQNKELLLFVPPSQVLRRILADVAGLIHPETLLVSASKGIENGTLKIMSEIFADLLPAQVAARVSYLSGPSFAREVFERLPTAVAVAACDSDVLSRVQQIFSTDKFRVYTNNDVPGVEVGGALKNVIALAAGVSDGLGFGHNTRAALITRGLAEISRIGVSLGADASTFSGLAGMGDLVLTCTGDLSRNRTVGIALGHGQKLDDILGDMNMVAEGVKTTLSAYQLARKLGVETPIIDQMYGLLYENKDARQAVSELMLRDLKQEE